MTTPSTSAGAITNNNSDNKKKEGDNLYNAVAVSKGGEHVYNAAAVAARRLSFQKKEATKPKATATTDQEEVVEVHKQLEKEGITPHPDSPPRSRSSSPQKVSVDKKKIWKGVAGQKLKDVSLNSSKTASPAPTPTDTSKNPADKSKPTPNSKTTPTSTSATKTKSPTSISAKKKAVTPILKNTKTPPPAKTKAPQSAPPKVATSGGGVGSNRSKPLYKRGAKVRALTDREEEALRKKRQEEYEIHRDQCTFRPQLNWTQSLGSPTTPTTPKYTKKQVDYGRVVRTDPKVKSRVASSENETTPRSTFQRDINNLSATSTPTSKNATTPKTTDKNNSKAKTTTTKKENPLSSPIVQAATTAAEKNPIDSLNTALLVNDTIESSDSVLQNMIDTSIDTTSELEVSNTSQIEKETKELVESFMEIQEEKGNKAALKYAADTLEDSLNLEKVEKPSSISNSNRGISRDSIIEFCEEKTRLLLELAAQREKATPSTPAAPDTPIKNSAEAVAKTPEAKLKAALTTPTSPLEYKQLIRDACAELELTKSQLAYMNNEMDALELVVQEQNDEVKILRQQREEISKSLTNEVSKLEQEVTSLSTQKEQLESQLQQKDGQLQQMHKDKELLNIELSRIKQGVEKLANEAKTLKESAKQSSAEKSQLEAKLRDKNVELEQMSECQGKLKEEVEYLEKVIREYKEELSKGKAEKVKLANKVIQKLEKDITQLSTEKQQLETQLQEKDAQLKEQSDYQQNLKEELGAAKMLITGLEEEETKDFDSKIESYKLQLNEKERDNKALRQQMKELVEDNKAAKIVIHTLEKEEEKILNAQQQQQEDSSCRNDANVDGNGLKLANEEIEQLKEENNTLSSKIEELEMNLVEAQNVMSEELRHLKLQKEQEQERFKIDVYDTAVQKLEEELDVSKSQVSELLEEKEQLETKLHENAPLVSRCVSDDCGEKDEVSSSPGEEKQKKKIVSCAPQPKKWRGILSTTTNGESPSLIEEEEKQQQQSMSNSHNVIDIDDMCLANAACTVPHEYQSNYASYHVRRPHYCNEHKSGGTDDDDDDCSSVGLEKQYGKKSSKLYASAFHAANPQSVEVIARIEADYSVLVLHGKSSVRHWVPCDDVDDSSNLKNQEETSVNSLMKKRRQKRRQSGWKVIYYVDGMNETLGTRKYINENGKECEYCLDTIFEEAHATREMYCMSLLSAASVLQDATLRESARQAEEETAVDTAAPVSAKVANDNQNSHALQNEKKGSKDLKQIAPRSALGFSTDGAAVKKEVNFIDDTTSDEIDSGAMDLFSTLLVFLATSFLGIFWSVCVRLPLRVACWTLIFCAVVASISILYTHFASCGVSAGMNAGINLGYNQAGIC